MDQRKVDVEQGVEATQPNKLTLDVNRRHALKKIVVGGGVAAGLTQLPTQWVRPVVDKVMVPAHAQTSEPCEPTGLFEEVFNTECKEQSEGPLTRYFDKRDTIYVDDEVKCEVGYETGFEDQVYTPAKGGYVRIVVSGTDPGVYIAAKGYDEDDMEIWSHSEDISDPCVSGKIGARIEGANTGEININNKFNSASGKPFEINGKVTYTGQPTSEVVIGPLSVGPA